MKLKHFKIFSFILCVSFFILVLPSHSAFAIPNFSLPDGISLDTQCTYGIFDSNSRSIVSTPSMAYRDYFEYGICEGLYQYAKPVCDSFGIGYYEILQALTDFDNPSFYTLKNLKYDLMFNLICDRVITDYERDNLGNLLVNSVTYKLTLIGIKFPFGSVRPSFNIEEGIFYSTPSNGSCYIVEGFQDNYANSLSVLIPNFSLYDTSFSFPCFPQSNGSLIHPFYSEYLSSARCITYSFDLKLTYTGLVSFSVFNKGNNFLYYSYEPDYDVNFSCFQPLYKNTPFNLSTGSGYSYVNFSNYITNPLGSEFGDYSPRGNIIFCTFPFYKLDDVSSIPGSNSGINLYSNISFDFSNITHSTLTVSPHTPYYFSFYSDIVLPSPSPSPTPTPIDPLISPSPSPIPPSPSWDPEPSPSATPRPTSPPLPTNFPSPIPDSPFSDSSFDELDSLFVLLTHFYTIPFFGTYIYFSPLYFGIFLICVPILFEILGGSKNE